MIALVALAAVVLQAPAEPAPSAGRDYALTWSAPAYLVRGAAFSATVEIRLPEAGGTIPAWLLTAAAFELDGRELGERGEGTLRYAGATTLVLELDLGPQLGGAPDRFRLGHAGAAEGSEPLALEVRAVTAAPAGIDFMRLEADRLGEFLVLLETSRGPILLELWPDVAPNHVRNFLDLASAGFYDGLDFHRAWPGFMIQGGDPLRKGRPKPPRSVDREFSDRKHEPGVLSMARVATHPDSATCQFFIMHAAAPWLDGQYSAFGKLVTGFDVVDRIANAPGDPLPAGGNEPREEQAILRATVLRAEPEGEPR